LKRTLAVAAGLAAFLGMRAEPAVAAAGPDAAVCLARPTVSCSVDLALAVSTSREDDARAQLILRASRQLKKPVARKAYFDRTVAQYFAGGTSGLPLLAHERRVADIATAIVAGDEAGADRLLAEDKDHFQRWWTMLADVLNTLAMAGRPDLAVATEAKHRRQVNVSRTDALGRKLGNEVWTTREPLARALVACACGPDPLPMVLALPNQDDRLDLAAPLYARRHDMQGLTALLTREFGDLARIKDKTQRRRIGYAFGLMLRELPLSGVPQALRARPAWLTADDFERPASGMQVNENIYGAVLARAVDGGDRAAVAAIVKLRPRGNTVWLSGATIDSPDAAAKVAPVLPKPERDRLRMLTIQFTIAHGDARKGVQDAMTSPMARGWRKLKLDNEDVAEFEDIVIAPLLARGAFDVADAAVRRLRDRGSREVMQETIAAARTGSGTKPKDPAAILAADWSAYQKAKADPDAGRTFLFAVRDLIAAQPNAFPFK
jgi:hypothetical protein